MAIIERPADASRDDLVAPATTYRFVARTRGRAVAVGGMIGALALLVVGGLRAYQTQAPEWIALAVVGALCAVPIWAMLGTTVPQVVEVTNSVIQIHKNGRTERFDLVDPNVEILAVDGAVAFRAYDGRQSVVRSQDVEWKKFVDMVMHYQNYADRKAVERTERFNRR